MTIAIVTCSGVSNTGKLTTQAGMMLMQRRPGRFQCMNCKQSAESLRTDASGAERLIVLDGCTDCCATKKLTAAGLKADIQIIATDLGIQKNGMCQTQTPLRLNWLEMFSGVKFDHSSRPSPERSISEKDSVLTRARSVAASA